MKKILLMLAVSLSIISKALSQQNSDECPTTAEGIWGTATLTAPCGQTGNFQVIIEVVAPPENVVYQSGIGSSDCYILPAGWSYVSVQYVDQITGVGGTKINRWRVTFKTTSQTASGNYSVRNKVICYGNAATKYSNYETGSITRSSPQFSISGPELACIGGTSTYTLGGQVPSGSTVNWSTSGSLSINSSNGGNQISVTGTSNGGFGNLTASVQSQCGTLNTAKNGIRTGTLPSANVTIQGVSPYGAIDVSADPGIASNYAWYRDGAFLQNGISSYQTLNGGNCGQHYIQVILTNACGTNNLSNPAYYTRNCNSARAYPNPAKEDMNVEFESASTQEDFPDQIDLISEDSDKPVYSVNVQEAYKAKRLQDGNKLVIPSSRFRRGTYYLRINNTRNKNTPVERIRVILN